MPEKGSENDPKNIAADVQTSEPFEKVTVSNKNTTVIETRDKFKKERE